MSASFANKIICTFPSAKQRSGYDGAGDLWIEAVAVVVLVVMEVVGVAVAGVFVVAVAVAGVSIVIGVVVAESFAVFANLSMRSSVSHKISLCVRTYVTKHRQRCSERISSTME